MKLSLFFILILIGAANLSWAAEPADLGFETFSCTASRANFSVKVGNETCKLSGYHYTALVTAEKAKSLSEDEYNKLEKNFRGVVFAKTEYKQNCAGRLIPGTKEHKDVLGELRRIIDHGCYAQFKSQAAEIIKAKKETAAAIAKMNKMTIGQILDNTKLTPEQNEEIRRLDDPAQFKNRGYLQGGFNWLMAAPGRLWDWTWDKALSPENLGKVINAGTDEPNNAGQ